MPKKERHLLGDGPYHLWVFLLQIADYFYFKALQDPDALIMLLSAIKRSQILIAVVIGGFIFKEQNKRKKLVPLAGIMLGVFLILYS